METPTETPTETTPVAPTQEQSEITFRLCEPRDSEAIARIVGEGAANGLYENSDVEHSKRSVQPSVLWAVAERGGINGEKIIVCAAPIYLAGVLPMIAISSQETVEDRKRGLLGLQDFFSVLLNEYYGVKSILTLSKS